MIATTVVIWLVRLVKNEAGFNRRRSELERQVALESVRRNSHGHLIPPPPSLSKQRVGAKTVIPTATTNRGAKVVDLAEWRSRRKKG